MSWIWENATVGGSNLLILLAMADFADDNGGSVYPSMKTLAKKARMSQDQARRVVHKLIADGHIELVQKGGWDGGRNRSNEYRLVINRTCKTAEGGTRKLQAPSADASTRTSADASTVLAPMQDDPSYIHHVEPPLTTDDEDKRAAFGAVFKVWADNIPGTMTPILGDKLHDLIDECGTPSVIHGIVTSVEAGARNFKYIAACARNHAQGKEPAPKAQARRNGPTIKADRTSQAFDNVERMMREKGMLG